MIWSHDIYSGNQCGGNQAKLRSSVAGMSCCEFIVLENNQRSNLAMPLDEFAFVLSDDVHMHTQWQTEGETQ
jgi:hypothetical protein